VELLDAGNPSGFHSIPALITGEAQIALRAILPRALGFLEEATSQAGLHLGGSLDVCSTGPDYPLHVRLLGNRFRVFAAMALST
jgi:hypothetical protein